MADSEASLECPNLFTASASSPGMGIAKTVQWGAPAAQADGLLAIGCSSRSPSMQGSVLTPGVRIRRMAPWPLYKMSREKRPNKEVQQSVPSAVQGPSHVCPCRVPSPTEVIHFSASIGGLLLLCLPCRQAILHGSQTLRFGSPCCDILQFRRLAATQAYVRA